MDAFGYADTLSSFINRFFSLLTSSESTVRCQQTLRLEQLGERVLRVVEHTITPLHDAFQHLRIGVAHSEVVAVG